MVLSVVVLLGDLEAPRPNAMPLLSGRPSRCEDCSEDWSFLPVKLLKLKLLGKNEIRREDLLLSEGASEFFLLKPKLVLRLLSVDVLGWTSSLLFGMAFLMLTGGYRRSRFSSTLGESCCCEVRRELLRPKMRSPILPRVLERLWPR